MLKELSFPEDYLTRNVQAFKKGGVVIQEKQKNRNQNVYRRQLTEQEKQSLVLSESNHGSVLQVKDLLSASRQDLLHKQKRRQSNQ